MRSGDVLEVDSEAFERVPETLSGVIREHVRGVYKLDGQLLLLLDSERVSALGSDAIRPGGAASAAQSDAHDVAA